MDKLLIFGHNNPDTDSIVSALIAEDYYKNVLRLKAKACRSGEMNNETKFVLEQFGFSAPDLVKKVKGKERLVLVDHNEMGQAVEGFNYSQVESIIDHHKATIETEKPISCRIEPVGSTSAVLARMYNEAGRKISKKLACLMLSGILSDTLNLTSPTTTESDKKLVRELNKVAKLNINKFVKDLFAAKSSLKGISLKAVIGQDYKLFKMGNSQVGISVWETTDPESINKEKDKLEKILKDKKERENLDYMFFMLVDIIREDSQMYVLGEKEEALLKKVFKRESVAGVMFLSGIVSRKKQIVPDLTAELTK